MKDHKIIKKLRDLMDEVLSATDLSPKDLKQIYRDLQDAEMKMIGLLMPDETEETFSDDYRKARNKW